MEINSYLVAKIIASNNNMERLGRINFRWVQLLPYVINIINHLNDMHYKKILAWRMKSQ